MGDKCEIMRGTSGDEWQTKVKSCGAERPESSGRQVGDDKGRQVGDKGKIMRAENAESSGRQAGA